MGFLYGFATAADSAIYSTAMTELSPEDRLGSAQALQAFTGYAVAALAPVFSGFLLDAAPSPQSGWAWVFAFNAGLAATGVLCLVWLRRLPEARRLARGRL